MGEKLYSEVIIYNRNRDKDFKTEDFNIDWYKYNPVVTLGFKYDRVVGKASHLHWEGADLLADITLKDFLPEKDWWPAIAYRPGKVIGEDEKGVKLVDTIELLSIDISPGRNVDEEILPLENVRYCGEDEYE